MRFLSHSDFTLSARFPSGVRSFIVRWNLQAWNLLSHFIFGAINACASFQHQNQTIFSRRRTDHSHNFMQIAAKVARNIYFYIFCYIITTMYVWDSCWRSFIVSNILLRTLTFKLFTYVMSLMIIIRNINDLMRTIIWIELLQIYQIIFNLCLHLNLRIFKNCYM